MDTNAVIALIVGLTALIAIGYFWAFRGRDKDKYDGRFDSGADSKGSDGSELSPRRDRRFETGGDIAVSDQTGLHLDLTRPRTGGDDATLDLEPPGTKTAPKVRPPRLSRQRGQHKPHSLRPKQVAILPRPMVSGTHRSSLAQFWPTRPG